MLSSLLSLASVMALSDEWCGHVFLIGRLPCMLYSEYIVAYPFDILVILRVMNYSNPVSTGLVLAQ